MCILKTLLSVNDCIRSHSKKNYIKNYLLTMYDMISVRLKYYLGQFRA